MKAIQTASNYITAVHTVLGIPLNGGLDYHGNKPVVVTHNTNTPCGTMKLAAWGSFKDVQPQ
jgi:hypothetical protein